MFQKLAYIENNIIGLIILLIIFLNTRRKHKRMKWDAKLFLALVVSNSLIMVLNIIINLMDGSGGYLFRKTNIVLTTIYFLLNPVPFMAWSLYVDFYIHRSVRRLKKLWPMFAIPTVISSVLIIASVFTNSVFFIDKNNVYNRGNLFWIIAVLYYSYFIFTYIQIIIKRKSIREKDYYSLFMFALLPAIAGILQIISFGSSFIWLSVSISILIIFINIQNDVITKDYLTGLYNRRELDSYLINAINELKKDDIIFMILLDLNDFKQINDQYGHIEGDEALKYTSEILIDSFRAEDFISRYAGDEFVIIVNLEDENDKKDIVSRLRRKFEEFNESGLTPYDISVSIGYDVYKPDLGMKADNFIIHVDKLMYKDKERIKGPVC